ncbi:MAG: ribosomal protein S18-alanine N-acetyltransferase [Candidatus Eisenbacteria bacterium]
MQRGAIAFRSMEEKDLPRVLVLERELFVDPWPRWVFLEEVRNRRGTFTVVGEEDGEIVCYGIVWVVRPEFHIANMAVRRDHQGGGLGKRLLDHVLEEGMRRGCAVATLEVRPSNPRAVGLYRSRAFREVAIRRGYYRNGEDALVMLRELGHASEK